MTDISRPIIAVTGSSGKTTTKEMIASILQRRWRILKSKNNRNNRHSVRAYAKQIKSYHRAVVLEYGMSFKGNLRQSCRILKPNMAVITMVGTAHIGNFGGSLDRLIDGKSEIIESMAQNGTLLINADDQNSKLLHTQKFHGKIVSVGIENNAEYQARDLHYITGGMTFRVYLNGTDHKFFIPIYGVHNVYNALFAIAVTHCLGFKPEQIRSGLKNYTRLGGRMRIYRLRAKRKLIDDTFNANPNSVEAAIDVLRNIGKGKNIAVLGSMTELGRYSNRGHQAVGKYLAGKNIDTLVTFGDRAKRIGEAAISEGFPPSRVTHVKDRDSLHKILKKEVSPGTTVLVKGSNIMRMSTAVTYLKKKYK